MDMMGALIARLLAAPDVAAIVGGRIDPVTRPDAENLPALTLQIIDEDREQHFDGFQSLQQALVQIDAWATTHLGAAALKEAVIAALVPADTVGGIAFQRSFVRSRDLGEPTPTGFVHRASMDFNINYSAQ